MDHPAPPDDGRLDLIETATGIDLRLRLAEAPGTARTVAQVSAADIWRAAALADPPSIERVGAAAAVDPATARAFSRALAAHAVADFPVLRAADTGPAEAPGTTARRRSGDWEIQVALSARRPDRCYLTITVPPGRPAPRLLACTIGETFALQSLPAPEEGVIQVVLERGDPVAVAALDRRATLSLR